MINKDKNTRKSQPIKYYRGATQAIRWLVTLKTNKKHDKTILDAERVSPELECGSAGEETNNFASFFFFYHFLGLFIPNPCLQCKAKYVFCQSCANSFVVSIDMNFSKDHSWRHECPSNLNFENSASLLYIDCTAIINRSVVCWNYFSFSIFECWN